MPTILFKNEWRIYFNANEGDEPPHVHAQKGDMECKLWLDASRFDIEEDYAYNLSPASRRELRRIVFENFDYLVSEYRRLHAKGES